MPRPLQRIVTCAILTHTCDAVRGAAQKYRLLANIPPVAEAGVRQTRRCTGTPKPMSRTDLTEARTSQWLVKATST